MRAEALTIRLVTTCKPLRKHIEAFITECTTKLPSHDCYLDEVDARGHRDIVLEDSEGYKHIVMLVESEPGEIGTADEFYEYACCKRYELKHKLEPATYNQSAPGLYRNYPYLYKVRISQATRNEIIQLDLKRRGANV